MIKLLIKFFTFLSFKLGGWTFENKLPKEAKKYLLIAVPHTSNWDMYYALTSFYMMKVPVRFAIKNDWLKFPFKKMMLSVGAIGVDRGKNKLKKVSLVDSIVELYNKHEELIICITPEGTRSRNPKWKTGFYHIAVKAKVPIAVGVCDYKNKRTTIHKLIYPSGNMKADLQEIATFYNPSQAKIPENFAFDVEATVAGK
ncbi:MAG: 1-acyl-sn-glycerol-3-phosphate acyltransferase [Bacteroidetes bacterium]|nr:1-acyl-sn-glycerol-3-phosphate acyltransferase [Bacteroidota bacterium]